MLGDVKAAADDLVASVGLLAQSLLGGFAFINLYMTYIFAGTSLPAGSSPRGFLHYYSPLASTMQSTYLVLVSMSLLTAIDKLSKDRLANFIPRGSSQRLRDVAAVAFYLVAFVVSLVLVPTEDLLYYAWRRLPNWWEAEPMSKQFARDLDAFLALNAFRVVCCAFAWLIVVTDLAPGVVKAAAQAEHAARMHLDAQIAAKRPAGRLGGGGFGSADVYLHGAEPRCTFHDQDLFALPCLRRRLLVLPLERALTGRVKRFTSGSPSRLHRFIRGGFEGVGFGGARGGAGHAREAEDTTNGGRGDTQIMTAEEIGSNFLAHPLRASSAGGGGGGLLLLLRQVVPAWWAAGVAASSSRTTFLLIIKQ